MEKEGGRQGAIGRRDQTPLIIRQQEAGNGSGVGDPTENIRGLCKGDGIQGMGEVAQAVVATDGCRTKCES